MESIANTLDIILTIAFLVIAGQFLVMYRKTKNRHALLMCTFFFIDSVAFTSVDVSVMGISKPIYDLIQIVFSLTISIVIIIYNKNFMREKKYRNHQGNKNMR